MRGLILFGVSAGATGVLWVAMAGGPALIQNLAVDFDPERAALRSALDAPGMWPMRSGYAQRLFRPIWLKDGKARPEARQVLRALFASSSDGLDPRRYDAIHLLGSVNSAGGKSWRDRAQTELMLTADYARYLADLHVPPRAAQMVYTDPALRPPVGPNPEQLLRFINSSPSLEAAVQTAARMNPLYAHYKQSASAVLTSGLQPARAAVQANMARLRAMPVDLGRRFVLVDTATARLWMYEDGIPVDTMKVIVGKPDEATPMMAGVIRYAVFNPRWNVPPDLVQRVYAPRFRADPKALAALNMDPWTGYTTDASQIDPGTVDWSAVEAGVQPIGLRQRPGPNNAMGAVKFMFPNALGIYLHDTPNKALFKQPRRTFSAGCVRVEDYRRLAHWLYRRSDEVANGSKADQRVDLAQPVPVYITYLTMNFEQGRLVQAADIYGRDQGQHAQLRSVASSTPK